MNANAIIKAALRRLVVVPSGGTPTANQYTDGLEVLNDMLNSWSADVDLIYEDTLQDITIAQGTQSFTIGATGDEVSGRPIEIIAHTLKDSSGYEYLLREMDAKAYSRIGDKTITSLPARLYYRETYPNGTFYFNCKTDEAYTLVLTSKKLLTEFPDGTTDVSLPEHYERALKLNLAIELAPESGAAKRVTQLMMQQAEQAKTTIIGKAMKLQVSVTELGRSTRYSISGDTY